jgi:predicted ATPase/DNA-binding XRE family transcriptional regulator
MDSDNEFGIWMRRLRAALDLTQDGLAEAVGCASQTIRAIESGRRRPSREMAERIAQILHVPEAEKRRFLQLARERRDELPPLADNEAEPSARPVPPLSVPSLRPPANALIGRASELGQLEAWLRDEGQRLVTIVGPGGIGKTRLAQQALIDFQAFFAHGAAFVTLVGTHEGHTLATTIAIQLGLVLPKDRPAEIALIDMLRQRQMLLVLDNLEHLLVPEQADAVSSLLNTLLRDTPGVALLATSRERLRLRSERVIELGGLALPQGNQSDPGHHSDALLLFLDCARRVVHTFTLTSENRPAIVRICELLEGTPLALELAAAWLPVLSPAEIAAEIERDLDFLALANRDAEAHHSSMRAVFERSWLLLSVEEQEVLPRLAVLRGSFTREAAAFVAKATISNLATLMQKSLLRRTSATHYDLHEVVRYYSLFHLPQQERSLIAQRHLDYYLAISGQAGVGFILGKHQQWVDQLLPEIDNLRAALLLGLEAANLEKGARLCAALRDFWRMQHFVREGISWNERYLTQPGLSSLSRGQLLLSQSMLTYLTADVQRSLDTAKAAVALLQDAGEPGALADALENLATAEVALDQHSSAQAHLETALELYQEHGTPTHLARVYNDLGNLCYAQEQVALAVRWYDKALALARANDDQYSLAVSLANLGAIRVLHGDPSGGPLLQEAVQILHAQHYQIGVAFGLELLAAYIGLQGNYERAVRILSAANTLRLSIQSPVTPENEQPYAIAATLARGPLDEAAFQRCWTEGSTLSLEATLALAMA